MALSMLKSPATLWWAPEDAADRREKMATMPVAVIYNTYLAYVKEERADSTCHAELATDFVREISFATVNIRVFKSQNSDAPKVSIPTTVPAKPKLVSTRP